MKVRKLLLIIFTIVTSMHVNAAKELTGAHMFGVAESFNDSTVYITDVQHVDSAHIGKSNFLFGRENYSYQLQNYLRSTGAVTPTCITVFAKDRKSIEKKYLSMRKKYEKSGKFAVKYVTAANFKYQGVTPQADEAEQEKAAKREAREERKAAKIAGKQAKRKERLAEKESIETSHPAARNDTKR